MPRRSVTRFFIPLIDVLTVLFCIFLLMPLIKAPEPGSDTPPGDTSSSILDQPSEAQALDKPRGEGDDSDLVRREQEKLDRLQNDKIEALEKRLFVRVLEIDADNGKLYTRDGEQRVEIASQAAALELIARQKLEAGDKELYYLFLFPRRVTGYPEERQINQYERWFKGVAHGRDNPLGGR
jgi:hypothetical protein